MSLSRYKVETKAISIHLICNLNILTKCQITFKKMLIHFFGWGGCNSLFVKNCLLRKWAGKLINLDKRRNSIYVNKNIPYTRHRSIVNGLVAEKLSFLSNIYFTRNVRKNVSASFECRNEVLSNKLCKRYKVKRCPQHYDRKETSLILDGIYL